MLHMFISSRPGHVSRELWFSRAGYEAKIVDDNENRWRDGEIGISGCVARAVCGVLRIPELTARTKRGIGS